jgi:hypothetical protein
MSHADDNDATRPVPAIRSGDADILRLAVAQALGGANSAVVFAIGAIVGNMLAPSKALSTLPLSPGGTFLVRRRQVQGTGSHCAAESFRGGQCESR